MNQSLNALMTKLNWQKNELELHLQAAESESLKLLEQLKEIEQTLNKSCSTPLIINPEFEINRLNYITQQHIQKEDLGLILKNHQALETKLKDKLQRTKTELKMLEKYLARESLKQIELQNKMQEQALDEWVIQKRDRL
jgi:hypothetical protein